MPSYRYIIILFFFAQIGFCIDDSKFHKISHNSALFIYQAFAKNDHISNKAIIRNHFRDFDIPLAQANPNKNRDTEIKDYIGALKLKNRFYFIVTIPFPDLDERINRIEVNLGAANKQNESAVKVLKYVYEEPIGVVEIFINNIKPLLSIPTKDDTAKKYFKTKKSFKAFVKVFAKVNKAFLDTDSSRSLDESTGNFSRTKRKVVMTAHLLELYTTSGSKIAELEIDK